MKIHNLGSDYAYQQKLKKEADSTQSGLLLIQPETKPIDDVENQLQDRRETTVATGNYEALSGEKDRRSKTKKATKEKKKEEAEDSQ